MTDHPITPPPELAAHWVNVIYGKDGVGFDVPLHPITLRLVERAAQWGADQELEACWQWANETGWQGAGDELRAVRRPKPSSLKEQALKELDKVDMLWATEEFGQETLNSLDTIRRAIESIPDPLIVEPTSMPDKETIQAAYEEFRAILAGGQNNREFYLSAQVVCKLFDQLLRELS